MVAVVINSDYITVRIALGSPTYYPGGENNKFHLCSFFSIYVYLMYKYLSTSTGTSIGPQDPHKLKGWDFPQNCQSVRSLSVLSCNRSCGTRVARRRWGRWRPISHCKIEIKLFDKWIIYILIRIKNKVPGIDAVLSINRSRGAGTFLVHINAKERNHRIVEL